MSPPELAPTDSLFGAFRTRPSRRNFKWAVGVVLALFAVEVAVVWSGRNVTQVVTRQGLRSLRKGMSVEEVTRVMGRPLATSAAPEGQVCLQYGTPQWRTAFVVYSVCYAEGKLQQVVQKRFGVWKLGQDGTFLPFKDEPVVRPLPRPGAL